MLFYRSLRPFAKSEGAIAVNKRGIEAFAWVWGGGTCLMAGTGHVAAGGLSDREVARAPHPAVGEVAPARHGRGDRLSEPVQIMRRPDSRLCVRCGRRNVELATRHAQTIGALTRPPGGKKIFAG